MNTERLAGTIAALDTAMQGVWWLESREDYNSDGQRRIDPVLGADPIGILTYAKNKFAVQLMKRDRTAQNTMQVLGIGPNNTGAIAGYDAYFGEYEVDSTTGRVAHTVMGSLNPANAGMTVSRDLQVQDDRLMITLETITPDGEPIVRTIVWKRITGCR